MVYIIPILDPPPVAGLSDKLVIDGIGTIVLILEWPIVFTDLSKLPVRRCHLFNCH